MTSYLVVNCPDGLATEPEDEMVVSRHRTTERALSRCLKEIRAAKKRGLGDLAASLYAIRSVGKPTKEHQSIEDYGRERDRRASAAWDDENL